VQLFPILSEISIRTISKAVTLILLLLMSVSVISCSKKTVSTFGLNHNESGQVAGFSEMDFKAGKKIYIQQCSGCHSLYLPSEYTVAEWKEILPVMFSKSKADTTEQRVINDYIMNSIESK